MRYLRIGSRVYCLIQFNLNSIIENIILMGKYNLAIILLFTILTIPIRVNASTIVVKDQKQFDKLNTLLVEELTKGCTVKIKFAPGVYYYVDNHINLDGIGKANTKIIIDGDSATLISKGGRGIAPSPYLSIIEKKDKDLWSRMYGSTEKIILLNTDNKSCKIKRSDSEEIRAGDYILITQWYTSKVYLITGVDKDYIYFIAADTRFREQYGEYDVNFDYAYLKAFPRYKVFKTQNTHNLYICCASTFLRVNRSTLHSISIKGIRFVGGSNNDAVVMLNQVSAKSITVDKCSFSGLKNIAIDVKETSNVFIDQSVFSQCYSNVIMADEKSNNLKVGNCEFTECGKLLSMPSCVTVSGKNYLIRNNKFVDFYGRALTLGVYFSKGEGVHSSGIVEENEFYLTPPLFEKANRELLMDTGAIYSNTINDLLIIRNNYIHDIRGAGDNNGIFLDDGARNVSIIGNIIVNTPSGYSISSRRVKSVEKYAGPVNVGNVIGDNILEHPIRFEGRENNNDCLLEANYFLVEEKGVSPKGIVSNVTIDGGDISINFSSRDGNQIKVDKNNYKVLRKRREWKHWRRYIVK